MSEVDVADALEHFIRKEFQVGNDPGFSREVHLYDSGVVDSIGVIELISFLQSRFEVRLEDREIFSEEFTTINGISRLVFAGLAERGSEATKLPVSDGA